jgi:hypothetical protein
MSDIVERLRRIAKELPQTSGNQAWLRPEDTTAWEAADEIEKLRAALRGVLTYYNAPTPAEAKLKKAVLATPIEQAYAALGEKKAVG